MRFLSRDILKKTGDIFLSTGWYKVYEAAKNFVQGARTHAILQHLCTSSFSSLKLTRKNGKDSGKYEVDYCK